MTVGQRLLQMPLLLLFYSVLFGIALVPAQSSLMTMMQLAVPDLKRGRVGSAMNAITTSASLLSMASAAALGEVVALRMIYVTAGVFVSAGGLELLVFAGPTMLDVVRRYNLYCGGGVLPPRWALGFWHRVPTSYSEQQVLDEVAKALGD